MYPRPWPVTARGARRGRGASGLDDAGPGAGAGRGAEARRHAADRHHARAADPDPGCEQPRADAGRGASKIYQGLLKFSPTLDALPELAKSWDVSDDKLTYTFHLQDNVKWHDGEPMTADDVAVQHHEVQLTTSRRGRARSMPRSRTPRAVDPLTVSLDARRAVPAVPADLRRDDYGDRAEAHLRGHRLPQQSA